MNGTADPFGLVPLSTGDAPGIPDAWRGRLAEVERLEWRVGDGGDPGDLVERFLSEAGLPAGDLSAGDPDMSASGVSGSGSDEAAGAGGVVGAALLLGADACARIAGLATGRPSPAPAVPDLVAVTYRLAPEPAASAALGPYVVGSWGRSWTRAAHAEAVEAVREAIARGDVYQVNVVGHRQARFRGDAHAAARVVAGLAGATYGGVLAGDGWAVASASPEALVTVEQGVARTVPIKGTVPVRGPSDEGDVLRDSAKDRAEHVMIVDLERNDLGRVADYGSVEVEALYRLRQWSGLWQAESVVRATLRQRTGLADLLRAVLPGGSVTGAPKRSAVAHLTDLEPVGRGPSMGALGFFRPDCLDLGLTIRTVAIADGSVHAWSGGGITWSSDPAAEVAEAEAKVAPIAAALAGLLPGRA